jgi:hypothetical protein
VKEGEESNSADECIRLGHLGTLLQANENRVLGELRGIIRLSFSTTKKFVRQTNRPPYPIGQDNNAPLLEPVGRQDAVELFAAQTSKVAYLRLKVREMHRRRTRG